MLSSRNGNEIILSLYQDKRSVFNMSDVAMISGEPDGASLVRKVYKLVKSGRLLKIRPGLYAKQGYTIEEVACKAYTPSYISLEYVLQRAGVVFQYDSRTTCISYLSRDIKVGEETVSYRKIKDEILIDTRGIERKGQLNIATPERAFLDMLYLDSSYYFDNPRTLDRKKIEELLPIYGSKKLTDTVKKILDDE